MNFSRYKSLLRLAQLSSRSADCRCESGLRLYSNDALFTSAAPHKFFKNVDENRIVDNDDDDNDNVIKKNNFRSPRPKNFNNRPKNVNTTKNYGANNVDTNLNPGKFTAKHSTKSAYNTNSNAKNFYGKFGDKNFDTNSNPAKFTAKHSTKSAYNTNSNAKNFKAKFSDENFKTGKFARSKTGTQTKLGELSQQYDMDPYADMVDLDDCDEEQIEVGEETEKLARSPKKVNKLNYKLQDNPAYRTELLPDEGIKQSVSENDNNDFFRNKRASNDSNKNLNKTEIFSKKDYPVYHFDPKLEEISDLDSNDEIDVRRKMMKSAEGIIEYDLSSDEFNINKYVKELINTEPLKPLDECKEDISDFGPGLGPSFNFASYANKSELVQEYVKLGVKLFKVEKDMDHMRALLTVDLKEELPLYVQFLHDCGVPADSLGDVITENPMILKEDLDDLKTRIRYLMAHDFTMENVARIVTKNPTWLTWSTKHIDERLGYFQNEFKLTANEVRYLATKQPKLITSKYKNILQNTFAVREEMGFTIKESKAILLTKPRLWINTRNKIVDSFDYLHNTMKLSHLMIVSMADILSCRKKRLQCRHEFLVELKKVQYDPKKPGYISPMSVASGSDVEFCRDVAKTSIETYNLFLKTL